MKLRLHDHATELAGYLGEFHARPFTPALIGKRRVSFLRRRIATAPCDLTAFDFGFLFRYVIFPPRILKSYGEWQLHSRTMRCGDTIVLQAQVPPGWGCHLIFGVRMVEMFHEAARVGFRYRTLAGHPESGENEFTFVRHCDGLDAVVCTVTGSGRPLSRLVPRFFTRLYASYCNQAALRGMTRLFLADNGLGFSKDGATLSRSRDMSVGLHRGRPDGRRTDLELG